jgi:predicted transcriptional regulator
MGKLVEDSKLLDAKVVEVMEESFPVIDAKTEIDQVKKILKDKNAVLVSDFGRITDIITRYDLIDFS